MKSNLIVGFSCLVAMLTTSSGYADVLVSYDFKGQDGVQVSTEPYQVAAHLEASAITRGAAYTSGVRVSLSKDGMAFVPKAEAAPRFFLEPYAMDAALQHGAYFEVTLTPEVGYSYSVRSILLGTRRASRRSGPNYLEVRSSLDGFKVPLISAVETTGPGGNESLDLYIDLGRSLVNLHTAITLRFYGYGRGLATDQPGIWVITNPAEGLAVIDGDIRKSVP